MRILQLTKKVPHPLRDGEAIAINRMAKGLVEMGCQVDLLAMNTSKHTVDPGLSATITGLSHYRSVKIVAVNTDVKPLPALRHLILRKSYNISRFDSAEYSAALSELLESEAYDVVLLETLYLTPYVTLIKAKSQAHVSLRSHNIESQIWYDLYLGAGRGLKRQYLKICADRLTEYESENLQSYDSILPITFLDAEKYKQQGYNGALLTIPVGMELAPHSIAEDIILSSPSPINAGYIGSMDWKPNIEGLRWFANKAWPRLAKDFDIEFHLAGRNMGNEWKELDLAGFHPVGEVESAEAFVQDLDLIIVPLFSGSGIRVKILEAMAKGKVVMSTPKGFEGIDIIDGVNGFIFNTDQEICECLTRLSNNPGLWQSIAIKARETIVNSFDNSVLAEKVVDLFSKYKSRDIS